ncbi:hypothetical protein JFL43_10600 [Viridibacillus sp. YIM B01967]|uniref:Sporulation protein Cse60 n=1 Tax=Viridibacillus soli TaxID=2798301 RepID=A0ABS1H789_9BACL|nr:hypothetical protein [Viridibacillus soli]MBK3495292.1 hypothetical protein [Viridibacillus soli]
MIKTHSIYSSIDTKLSEEINDWLTVNLSIEVIDIKYASVMDEECNLYESALIIYNMIEN